MQFEWTVGNIVVEDNVFIGANSSIRYGVTIGHDSIIAMGSVVVKDVPSNSVVGGNPARLICSFGEYVKKLSDRQKRGMAYGR